MNLGETRVEEALEEDSIIVSSCIRDVLVPVADYVFDETEGAVEPEVSDIFEFTIDGAVTRLQVVPIQGERSFRIHDREERNFRRIHTKEIG